MQEELVRTRRGFTHREETMAAERAANTYAGVVRSNAVNHELRASRGNATSCPICLKGLRGAFGATAVIKQLLDWAEMKLGRGTRAWSSSSTMPPDTPNPVVTPA